MVKLNTHVKNFKKFIAQTLFPKNFCCLLCDIEIFEGELCSDCKNALRLNTGTICPKCGRKTAKSEICIECKAHMPAYERAFSPFVYEGTGGDLVSKYKSGYPFLADYLAERILLSLGGLPKTDGVVYVPATARNFYERGYNQSKLLAERVAEGLGVPVLEGAVVKIKETVAQKELYREQRLKNLQDCFKADKNLVKGKTLLIVDDVMTTGATTDAMASCLKKAGAGTVFVATAASVEYKAE